MAAQPSTTRDELPITTRGEAALAGSATPGRKAEAGTALPGRAAELGRLPATARGGGGTAIPAGGARAEGVTTPRASRPELDEPRMVTLIRREESPRAAVVDGRASVEPRGVYMDVVAVAPAASSSVSSISSISSISSMSESAKRLRFDHALSSEGQGTERGVRPPFGIPLNLPLGQAECMIEGQDASQEVVSSQRPIALTTARGDEAKVHNLLRSMTFLR